MLVHMDISLSAVTKLAFISWRTEVGGQINITHIRNNLIVEYHDLIEIHAQEGTLLIRDASFHYLEYL